MNVLVCIAPYALAAAGLTACGGAGAADAPPPPAIATVVASSALVTVDSFAGGIDALGTVTVRPEHVASLGAPGPSRVASVRVSVGDQVRRGTVLVELDPASFEAAAQSSKAALLTSTRAFERARRLVEAGVLPQKDLDLASSDLAQSTATAAAARRQRSLATLRSPIRGVVTRLSATLGAGVDAATALVEIADPTFVDVILSVSAAEAVNVATGMRVVLSTRAADVTDSLGVGRVSAVAATIDSATRTVAVRVGAIQSRRSLRIGESVNGRVLQARRAGVILVPALAVIPDGDAHRVFVVDGSGIVHSRRVTIGSRQGDRVEIVSGLQVSERIVTDGAYQVDDGVRIVPPR